MSSHDVYHKGLDHHSVRFDGIPKRVTIEVNVRHSFERSSAIVPLALVAALVAIVWIWR